jgi:hypothetical protein
MGDGIAFRLIKVLVMPLIFLFGRSEANNPGNIQV